MTGASIKEILGEIDRLFVGDPQVLKIIATEHHMRTFGWYLPGKPFLEEAKRMKFDLFDPQYADLYWNEFTSTKEKFVEQWKGKLLEVIGNYRPDVLWFDGGEFQSPDVAGAVMSTLARYYNQGGAGVEVLNKFAGSKQFNFPREFGMLTYEAGRDRPPVVDRPWIDDLSIGIGSWGYVQGLEIRDPTEVIRGFVDRVSRGGGLLLSLSPTAAGEIPADQQALLREMGNWLKVNGEAIYGTRPWKIFGGGPGTDAAASGKQQSFNERNRKLLTAEDYRFSTKGETLYAFVMGRPEREVALAALGIKGQPGAGKIRHVEMLGFKGRLEWSQDDADLKVKVPQQRLTDHAVVFKIAGA